MIPIYEIGVPFFILLRAILKLCCWRVAIIVVIQEASPDAQLVGHPYKHIGGYYLCQNKERGYYANIVGKRPNYWSSIVGE